MARGSRRRAVALFGAIVALGACSSAPLPQTRARGPVAYDGASSVVAGYVEGFAAGPIPVSSADPARGGATAPVTIVEFADFECPFCQRAAETMAALQREYGAEQVRVVWKNYPLSFHRDARPAAEVAMALFARRGGPGFWGFHDAVFATQQRLGRAVFEEAARASGVGAEEIASVGHAAARKVEADEQLGRDLGVTGTPAFFVNGVLVHGAQPIERFRALVDAELEAARRMTGEGISPARVYAERTTRNYVPPRPEPADEDEPEDRTVYRVPVAGSPARGKATALVTIVEFADFECPFCFRAEDTLRKLSARYGDKVRVVWKNMPLPFHEHAGPAAEFALEALAQKGEAGFWRAHDLLLAQEGHLADGDLEKVARAAGLDAARAMRSVGRAAHAAELEQDMDLAEDVDATGTPTFFVNGRKLVGAQPLEAFQAAVEEQLKLAEAAIARAPASSPYDAIQASAKLPDLDVAPVPAPTAASPSRGSPAAKVAVEIWSDLECPFCKRVEPTLAALEAAFPGKVRIVWHNHPIGSHPHAMAAAEAVMEAFAQKGAAGFWKMHDLVLENQGGAGQERAALEQYAATVGLDVARFRAALDAGTHRAAILADAKIGEAAGLDATPGFVINGYRVSGALPLRRFKKVVRRALAEAK